MIPSQEVEKPHEKIENSVLVGDTANDFFIQLCTKSPRTCELYQKNLTWLFEDLGYTTESFISEYDSALEEKDTRKIKRIMNKVKGQLKALCTEYKTNTVLQRYKAFLEFLRTFYIDNKEFDYTDLNNFRKNQIEKRKDIQHIAPMQKEDIKGYIEKVKILARSELTLYRNLALIHLLKDTGMDRSTVVLLNYEDIKQPLEEYERILRIEDKEEREEKRKNQFFIIDSIRKKEGNKQFPVIGYETIEVLHKYIKARTKEREKYVTVSGDNRGNLENREREYQTVEGETLEDESPLFVYYMDRGEIESGDRITADTVGTIFTALNRHFDKDETTYTPHSLRKYNWRTLEYNGFPKNYAMITQGRSISDSSDSYTLDPENVEEDREKLISAYRKVYPKLSLEGETVSPQRVESLEEELRKTKEKLDSAVELMKKAQRERAEEMRKRSRMLHEQEKRMKDEALNIILGDPKILKKLKSAMDGIE
jgi:hypothetical protein